MDRAYTMRRLNEQRAHSVQRVDVGRKWVVKGVLSRLGYTRQNEDNMTSYKTEAVLYYITLLAERNFQSKATFL